MAKPEHGQRPKHKQWVGAYRPKPSTVMKYRIPERLVQYLIEQLGLHKWGGNSQRHPPSPQPEPENVQVVTRHHEYVDIDSSSSDEEPEQVPAPHLHPSRSTMGRRRAAGKERVSFAPSAPVVVGGDVDEDVSHEFHTPPGSPIHPSDPGFQPRDVATSSNAPPHVVQGSDTQGGLLRDAMPPPLVPPSIAPPPAPKPLFRFKRQGSGSEGPPEQGVPPAREVPGQPAPAPKRARQHRPDEAAATPADVSTRLPSLV